MDTTFTGYPVANGHPQLHGSYIPNLFAKKLLGQIKNMGDQVTIRTLPSITIRDYVKGQALVYEQLTPDTVDLLIDKGKYWAFPINDLDVVQSDLDYQDEWARHASESLAQTIDTLVLSDVYGDVHAKNTGATAWVISGNIDLGATGGARKISKDAAAVTANSGEDTVLDYIVNCGQVLDEQNVPESGRFMVIPAWMAGMIKKSDLRDASLTGDNQSALRNGRLGMIDRFTLFKSNNLTKDSDGTHIIFGTKHALTFASQMTKTETLRNFADFGDVVRGLQVFGYKVVKPEALGHGLVVAC